MIKVYNTDKILKWNRNNKLPKFSYEDPKLVNVSYL